MAVTTTTVRGFHSVCLEYDLHDSDPATVDFVAMLVAFLKPEVVVEAGTYRGRMTLAIANMLRLAEGGTVYTADPYDGITGHLQRPELQDVAPFIQYHQGDYLEMLGKVPGDIDLAYIDASHVDDPHMRWEHTMATYLRMRQDGLILVDDTASDGWDDAKKLRGIANVFLPGHRGLTIIQKRRPWG